MGVGVVASEHLRYGARGAYIEDRLLVRGARGVAIDTVRDMEIHLGSGMSDNETVAVFCHELVHATLRLGENLERPDLTYAQEELVAEAAASLVIQGLGIEAVADEDQRFLETHVFDLAGVHRASELVHGHARADLALQRLAARRGVLADVRLLRRRCRPTR